MTAHAPDEPRRGSLAFQNLLLTALLAGVVAVGFLVTNGIRSMVDAVPTPQDLAAVFEPEPYQEIGPVVIESVKDLAELTTVEMVEHTIVEKGVDEGWLEWARGDSIRLLAVASIGAGVDLSGIQASDFAVSDEGAVSVRIPPAELLYVAVDNEATQVLDRDLGLFTKGDDRLESETRAVAETVLVDQALAQGLLQEAEDNAATVITNLLLSLGYRSVTVEFTG